MLKFCRLSWCSASHRFVSDSWATCRAKDHYDFQMASPPMGTPNAGGVDKNRIFWPVEKSLAQTPFVRDCRQRSILLWTGPQNRDRIVVQCVCWERGGVLVKCVLVYAWHVGRGGICRKWAACQVFIAWRTIWLSPECRCLLCQFVASHAFQLQACWHG